MDSFCALRRPWMRAVVIVGLLGFLGEWHAGELPAQTPGKPEETGAAACATRDVRSRHFLLHTDLSPGEADEYLERLETMLVPVCTYWGQPLRGVIECFVIRHLDQFPLAATVPAAIEGLKTAGGATLMQNELEGKRHVAKSVVYSRARLEVLQHEAIHAYCYQTFGRIGPVWYSEGMAEMGHYWNEGDTAVCADQREIDFLRNNPPKSLTEPLSLAQVTGDSWQNYASRWALCHFLISNPNYAKQFRQLGRRILAGKDASFEQTYGTANRQLFFEYLFFLQHIDRGYRVDLCAWDWRKKSACLQAGRTATATILASRGWQPAGLLVRSGTQCEYVASGAWQLTADGKTVDADGNDRGGGRLVGVVMKDFELGEEFELGTKGSLQFETDGELYLRCRDTWNELADNSGQVTVKLQLQGQRPCLCGADGKTRAGDRTTCPAVAVGGQ